MAEPMERFVLPRTDWVDEQGRIYKDALIENLNAIEAKLQEIQALDIFEVTMPDVSDIQIEDDVTLSSPDNKILNLRSFLNITHLEDYPVECSFNGTKIKKLCWWHDNTYNTLVNKETGCNTTNKYIHFNPSTGTITSSSSSSITNNTLIGVWTGGEVMGINGRTFLGVNLLEVLSKMSLEVSQTYEKYRNTQFSDYGNAGRIIGAAQTEWGVSRSRVNKMIFHDIGRYYT